MNPVSRIFSTPASLAPTVLRLALATVFIYHGGQKTFGWFGGKGWSATMTAFTASDGLNFPYWLAALGVLAEVAGAAGLLFGVFTRVAAFGIFCTMLVAIYTVHLANGFGAPTGFEYPFTLASMAFALVCIGGGRFSIDRGISRQLLP
jgi:putative oxidoreductase